MQNSILRRALSLLALPALALPALALVAPSAASAASAAPATTWVVDPGGFGDFLTIQEAIDASAPGDTIVVNPGVYVEELVVPVTVTIAGAGVGQTIVRPATSLPGSGPGSQLDTTTWLARVAADDVVLSGISFEGDNPDLGGPVDARGGIVTDFTAGTFDGLTVIGCEVADVAYRGIYAAAGGSGHTLSSNTVRNVSQQFLDSVGIFLYGAVGEARNNHVSDCSIGIGFQSGGGGDLTDNLLEGCDLGLLANGSTSPVTMADNTFDDCAQGMQGIAVNTTVSIQGNTATGCTTGLTLFGLGSGSYVVEDNSFDGQSIAGSSALFLSTDVSPWGYGDLHVVARRNVLSHTEVAVALYEDPVNNHPLLDLTLSGAASDYNTFTGSGVYNVELSGCDDDVAATHNFWGAVNAALIEQTLYHQPDDPTLGLIDFSDTVNLLITVDDDGPADFPTINPAVQALLPGGTILVMPGLYQQDVVVDRSCVIQGSGTSSDPSLGTVLQGASIHPDMCVVTVTGPDVFLHDLRVDGQQPVYNQARRAVYGNTTSGLTVTDCVIHTATSGIAYVSSTGGTFLRNEVYDFGKSLQEGGGIFLWNSEGDIGATGQGNYVHDGLATALIHHNSSSGTCVGNLAVNAPLGHLSNGSKTLMRVEGNEAEGCDQGFQGIANKVAVDYVDNRATFCRTGFTLFGLGSALHTYSGNVVQGDGVTAGTRGFWWTTASVFGDADLNAVARGNSLTMCEDGVATCWARTWTERATPTCSPATPPTPSSWSAATTTSTPTATTTARSTRSWSRAGSTIRWTTPGWGWCPSAAWLRR